LAEFSHYRIGGPARYFAEADDLEELRQAINFGKGKPGLPIFFMGGGTNILFDDAGFPGTVIRINFKNLYLSDKNILEVGAGVPMARLVKFCRNNSLAGMEWAAGLPGTVGGAIRGNAGAFGREMGESVIEVRSLNLDQPGRIFRRRGSKLEFGYRTSFFKKNEREVILSSRLKVKKGRRAEIDRVIAGNLKYRRDRQPLEFPSAGSTFKNIPVDKIPPEIEPLVSAAIKTDPFPVVPVAFLISEAGLKGERRGGAEISEKHPNFIINRDKATAADVRALIELAKKSVKEKFGVNLEEEIISVPAK